MSILIRRLKASDCRSSEITPQNIYYNRRQHIKGLLGLGAGFLLNSVGAKAQEQDCAYKNRYLENEKPTDLYRISHYNNYYEFSTDKEAVAVLAQAFNTEPWALKIIGEVEKPITLDIESIKASCLVERTYRLRCVEGWSMVIPWVGVPLVEILKRCKILSSAKFVRFIGTERPSEMIGQRRPSLSWPYMECLRIDEAVHPLTLLATGLYGEELPKQNGAPIRLVVPWKYGFKSIKAIQTIELLNEKPTTTWMQASPSEYGFYANVNPDVAHPRWSQRREVRIGEIKKIKTLPFNGYAEEVSHLYSGMDLSKHF